MKTKNSLFSTMVLMAVILTACGGKPTPDAMMDKPTEEVMMPHETPTPDALMMHETPTADTMMPDANATPGAMMENPAWFSASLTNSRTSQSFTINDFKGKVVLVEMMAVWCSNCLHQQEQIKAYHQQLGSPDDLVSLSIDIDPNENMDTLSNYVNRTGFDWIYTVAPADVSHEIAALYGDQFLNPPSTPVLIVDRHGVAHPLQFGLKSADDLMKAIQPYLDGSM